jgi:Cu/Ag efflux protein CusF
MKPNRIIAAIALSCAALSHAQTSAGAHAGHHAQAATALSDAEVRKIDREQGKLTLKHGPIANLDMPGMTMVFRVADPKMLDAVKEGDRVKFAADKINGAYTVTVLETAR